MSANTSTNPTTDATTGSSDVAVLNNYVNGKFVEPQQKADYMNVMNPSNGRTIGKVVLSNQLDVESAVNCAQIAYTSWSTNYTIKARAAIILKFHSLVQQHATELAELIVMENGKNISEALADIAKGNETVEYAASIANSIHGSGHILPVSSGGIICEDRKQSIGVIASIVPFNFPFMVPMWTVPIALVLGNTVIIKPSEKVPLTIQKTISLWEQAGLPSGVFNVVHGTRSAVEALIQHPKVKAVTFVGSSPVAESIAQQCSQLSTTGSTGSNKRCIALGGAKNHLIALSDCHIPSTAQDIVTSFCGCTGQRCMAASVLLLVNNTDTEPTPPLSHDDDPMVVGDTKLTNLPSYFAKRLVNEICHMTKLINPGNESGQMGPVIDEVSYTKINSYIDYAVNTDGAQILVDGRNECRYIERGKKDGGHWIGPTILFHKNSSDKTMIEEVFGPVLSIYCCSSWNEAIRIENSSPYGNAASIYTTNGGHAQYFLSQMKAAMLGCNIGIPVPREPFSFGGLYGTKSKYGTYPGDITGDSLIEFFTNRIKVTSKWPVIDPTTYDDNDNKKNNNKKEKLTNIEVDDNRNNIDHASFAGKM